MAKKTASDAGGSTEGTQQDPKDRGYLCEICGRSFKTPQGMASHKKTCMGKNSGPNGMAGSDPSEQSPNHPPPDPALQNRMEEEIHRFRMRFLRSQDRGENSSHISSSGRIVETHSQTGTAIQPTAATRSATPQRMEQRFPQPPPTQQEHSPEPSIYPPGDPEPDFQDEPPLPTNDHYQGISPAVDRQMAKVPDAQPTAGIPANDWAPGPGVPLRREALPQPVPDHMEGITDSPATHDQYQYQNTGGQAVHHQPDVPIQASEVQGEVDEWVEPEYVAELRELAEFQEQEISSLRERIESLESRSGGSDSSGDCTEVRNNIENVQGILEEIDSQLKNLGGISNLGWTVKQLGKNLDRQDKRYKDLSEEVGFGESLDVGKIPPTILENVYQAIIDDVVHVLHKTLGSHDSGATINRTLDDIRSKTSGSELFRFDGQRLFTVNLAKTLDSKLISAKQIQATYKELLARLLDHIPHHKPKNFRSMIKIKSQEFAVERVTMMIHQIDSLTRKLEDSQKNLNILHTKLMKELERVNRTLDTLHDTQGFLTKDFRNVNQEFSAVKTKVNRTLILSESNEERIVGLEATRDIMEQYLQLINENVSGSDPVDRELSRKTTGEDAGAEKGPSLPEEAEKDDKSTEDGGGDEGGGGEDGPVSEDGDEHMDAEGGPDASRSDLPEKLDGLKKTDLQDLCRERGLPVSGTKAVLADRLRQSVEDQKGTVRDDQHGKTGNEETNNQSNNTSDTGSNDDGDQDGPDEGKDVPGEEKDEDQDPADDQDTSEDSTDTTPDASGDGDKPEEPQRAGGLSALDRMEALKSLSEEEDMVFFCVPREPSSVKDIQNGLESPVETDELVRILDKLAGLGLVEKAEQNGRATYVKM